MDKIEVNKTELEKELKADKIIRDFDTIDIEAELDKIIKDHYQGNSSDECMVMSNVSLHNPCLSLHSQVKKRNELIEVYMSIHKQLKSLNVSLDESYFSKKDINGNKWECLLYNHQKPLWDGFLSNCVPGVFEKEAEQWDLFIAEYELYYQ